MKEADMQFVVNVVDKVLMNADDTALINSVRGEVNEFMKQFVLYPEL
jgi:glycine hydroxymethyltransferase